MGPIDVVRQGVARSPPVGGDPTGGIRTEIDLHVSGSPRGRVHEHVLAHPGAHLREIARALTLPLGTALYHLDQLATRGVLVARRDGRYKRFFVANTLGRRDKDLVTAFRHATPRRIAQTLLLAPGRTQRDMCDAIGVSRSTLSFHLKAMGEAGIVACEERWPENRYRLTEPDEAARLLAQYRESFETVTLPAASTPTTAAVEVAST